MKQTNPIMKVNEDEEKSLSVVHSESLDLPSTGDPIMDMAQRASQNNDVATLKALLEIRDQEKANAAKQAFNSAFAKAQAEFPIIPRRGRGHNNIQYARLEDIMQAVKPILAKYGMGLRHRTETKDGVTVTAVLSHIDGHFEEDVFEAGADASGSKNAVQAIKSTITYARRATAENILGLASHNEDDDAFASGDTDSMAEWRGRIDSLETVEEADKARADLMSSTEISNQERVKIGHIWTAKRKTLKEPVDA